MSKATKGIEISRRMASIYALVDPDTGELRYIGKANDPAKRLKGHMRESRRLMRPVNQWVRSMCGAVEMVVLREDCEDWEGVERQLIADARKAGYPLLNVADGGAMPFTTLEQCKANGRKTAAIMRGEIPRRREFTAVELVIDTYEWLARYAVKHGYQRILQKVLNRMALRYREDPVAYAQWGWVVKHV